MLLWHAANGWFDASRREDLKQEETSAPVVAPSTATVAPAQTAPAEIPSGQSTKDFKVETDNYIAIFTTQGARLKSFKFEKSRSSQNEEASLEIVFQTPPACRCRSGVRLRERHGRSMTVPELIMPYKALI